jgi:hypothetical protein
MTTSLLRILAAAVLGAVYLWCAIKFWDLFSVANPVSAFLLDALAHNGYRVAYRGSILVHDIAVNIVLALPFAAVLTMSQSLRHWVYVVIAAATAVVCSFAFFTSWEGLPLVVGSWGFWLGVGMTAFSLPVAFALLNRSRFGGTSSYAGSNAA